MHIQVGWTSEIDYQKIWKGLAGFTLKRSPHENVFCAFVIPSPCLFSGPFPQDPNALAGWIREFCQNGLIPRTSPGSSKPESHSSDENMLGTCRVYLVHAQKISIFGRNAKRQKRIRRSGPRSIRSRWPLHPPARSGCCLTFIRHWDPSIQKPSVAYQKGGRVWPRVCRPSTRNRGS